MGRNMNKAANYYIFLNLLWVFSFNCIYSNQSLLFLRRERVTAIGEYLDFVEDRTAALTHQTVLRDPNYIAIRGSHLNHSRNLIIAAADIALEEHDSNEPTRALIVGAGNCLDIPIKELVSRFDEVYLLDLAYRTTGAIARDGKYFELTSEDGNWKAVEEELSEEERRKIKFVLSDVAGGAIFEIVNRVEDILNSERVTEKDVLALFDSLTMSELPFKAGYFDFISSSTVLSELLNLVENYIMSQLYERDASFYVNDIEVGEALIRLNEEISRFHLRESHRMLADNGRFYLSAARFVAEVFAPIQFQSGKAGEFLPEGKFIRHLVREISMPEDLITLTSDYFSIFPDEQSDLSSWLWPIDSNMAIGVQALTLAKRDQLLDADSSEELKLTSRLIETAENIYIYNSPNKDAADHFMVSIPDHVMNEGLFILNRRLDHLIRDEFKGGEIYFGEDFIPHLYATSLILINRKDLRKIFFGNDLGNVNSVSLDGKITLTRLVRIANNVDLKNVDFKATVYVGNGWVLEDIYAERSIFSESITGEETVLSDTRVVGSYLGFGADISADIVKDTIIPEGRFLRADVSGLMGEERALAEYLSSVHDGLDIQELLNGNKRVPGSDIDNLYYTGRVTSLASAFCLLLQQGELYLVENYMHSIPQEVEDVVRDRMSIISVFIDHHLYEIINGLK